MLMTKELFKLLSKKGIDSGPAAFSVVDTLTYEEAFHLAMDCFESITSCAPTDNNKLFRFAPISSISGGKSPCNSVSCRLEAAYSLSLIGVLYADHIVLPNFFDYIYYMVYADRKIPETEEEMAQFAYNLASDIAVYYQYRPLFEAGIASINNTMLPMCVDCHNRHIKESQAFQEDLEGVLKSVESIVKKKVRFIFDEFDYITIENDDNYLGGELGWGARKKLLKEMQKHSSQLPYLLSDRDVRKFGLRDKIITDSINDILEYDYYPDLKSCTYLTNRQLDIDLIEKTKKHSKSAKLTNKFPVYHEVPYLEDIVLEDLVAFRMSNTESFQVYRDAVTELIKKDSEEEAKIYFRETVSPAINTIENAIAANKEHFRGRAGKKVTIRSVVALAGIATTNLLGLPIETALSVAGTTGFLTSSDIIEDIKSTNETPTEARTNSFYFLWGIKQKHTTKKSGSTDMSGSVHF